MARIAMCGAGWIAGVHAAAIRATGDELVAVASRSPERAAEQAARWRSRAVALDELPASADVVIVATAPVDHARSAIRLLEAGAAVLLEKPLCRTLEEADAIVAAAAAHGERLLYAENLAYAPAFVEMVRRAGDLGALTNLEVRTIQTLPTWGDFTGDEWGGGALFDLGVHPLALALLLAAAAGEGRPTAVEATLRGGEGHGTDEHAEVTLRFPSGFAARVVASWQGDPAQPVWDVQAAGATGVLRLEMLPEVLLERDGEPVALPQARGEIPILEQFGYAGQLRALVEDSAAGRRPVMSAAFGRDVLQVVCAAYSSAARSGEAVALPFAGPRHLTPLELWRLRSP
ncbi:MAG: Gfo/Idh/MocA family oxidoreductase [Ilumatobacteraceae bacterium]